MKVSLFIAIILLQGVFWVQSAAAQETELVCHDSTFCTPNIQGMPRPKGLWLAYDRIAPYSIRSYQLSTPEVKQPADISSNTNFRGKLRFPIINKHHFRLIGGFEYATQNYNFSSPATSLTPLFETLENRTLRKIGASVSTVNFFAKSNSYVVFNTKVSLNGDYGALDLPKSQFAEYAITAVYGWKRTHRLTYGVGVYYNNYFGNQRFLPVLTWLQTFNDKWGIEILLPGRSTLRFSPSKHAFIYLESKIKSDKYLLGINDSSTSDVVRFRQTELRHALRLEHEIHDWLWFHASAGLRKNFRFQSEDRLFPTNTGMEAEVKSAPFFKVGLFIVPPQKLLDKHSH